MTEFGGKLTFLCIVGKGRISHKREFGVGCMARFPLRKADLVLFDYSNSISAMEKKAMITKRPVR
jgi:hypothetical protein